MVDPEVSTLTTLTNVQNALFVPDIPFLNRYYNRRPTYELTRGPSRVTELSEPITPSLTRQVSRVPTHKPVPPTPEPPEVPPKTREQNERVLYRGDSSTPEPLLAPDRNRRASITSHVEDDHYAVLPHGVTLDGWTQDDVDMLDDYVRHMLHSRRSKFKQSMKGFGKYIRKRKYSPFPTCLCTLMNSGSSWFLRHSLRLPHHSFRFYLGSLSYRLDLTRCAEGLYRSYRR